PGIAALCGWEIPRTNVIVNEEETHANSLVLYEKTIPKTLNIHDFLKFYESVPQKNTAVNRKSNIYFSPFLSIFSPPPEA
ncbi:MAG: hypothetical protein EOO18_05725, partial [Chryseobacterium sp.]